jgi:hypothetical protein
LNETCTSRDISAWTSRVRQILVWALASILLLARSRATAAVPAAASLSSDPLLVVVEVAPWSRPGHHSPRDRRRVADHRARAQVRLGRATEAARALRGFARSARFAGYRQSEARLLLEAMEDQSAAPAGSAQDVAAPGLPVEMAK